MKIYIYQRLNNDSELFEKISDKYEDVYDFAIKDIKSFFGSELGTKPSDPDNDESEPVAMKIEEWDIEEAIDLINYVMTDSKKPELFLRFSEKIISESKDIDPDKIKRWVEKISNANQWSYVCDWIDDYCRSTADEITSRTSYDKIKFLLENGEEEFLNELLE